MPPEARSEIFYPHTKAAFLAKFLAVRTGVIKALIEEEEGRIVALSDFSEEFKRRISLSREGIIGEIERLRNEFGLVGVSWTPLELDWQLSILDRSGVVETEGEMVRIEGQYGLNFGDAFSLSEEIEESIARGAREEAGKT